MSSYTIPAPYNEEPRNFKANSEESTKFKEAIHAFKKTGPREIPLVIGGNKIFDRQKAPLECPHDRTLNLGSYALATSADLTAAIDAALAARKVWSKVSLADRAAVFLKAADLISGKYRDEIAIATMLGQSKTCVQAEVEAVAELADFFRFNAHFAQKISEDQPLSPKGQWNRVEPRPIEGFVLAIAPFNFTAISLNLACAPALMGCGVVWKPSPHALLASYVGYQALLEAGLPDGVINLISGDPESIAKQALEHPELGGIHFTGSTAVFKKLWQEASANLKNYRSYPRIVGETGGKDFVFAHPSADPDALIAALIRGAYEYQGQKCSAASRAYIPETLWTKIKSKLIAEVATIKVGDPCDFKNFMGAVINERAFNQIAHYIEHARGAADADLIFGGEYNKSTGYFIKPALIETRNPQYLTMVEEIFGPVLTIYPYPDHEEEKTLALCANTSQYALTGAIFARNRLDIDRLSNALRDAAGNFYINDKPTGAVVGQQPFGGARGSGTNDKAGSILNLLRWVSHRTIKENFAPPTDYRYPYMD